MDAALAAVPKERADLASSSLRVSSLSFAALGGGSAINAYFKKSGAQPRFYPLIYNALGGLFVEKKRFSDAAVSYAAFIERYPQHASAPKFQSRVIEAYDQGGLTIWWCARRNATSPPTSRRHRTGPLRAARRRRR